MEQWKIWLIVADGPNAGDTIPVGCEQFLIGRRASCHFRPAGEDVAELHCAILARDDRFFLRNYRQPEGTSVDGRQVLGGIELRDGDRFQVGEWHLQARIARRPCLKVEAAPPQTAILAGVLPSAALGNVACTSSCSGWPSPFFVTCNSVLPIGEQSAPNPAASDENSNQSTAEEGEELEASGDLPGIFDVEELPELSPLEGPAPGSAPETLVSEETPYCLPTTLETEPATGENSEASGVPACLDELDQPALSAVEESAHEMLAESAQETVLEPVAHEETAYVPLSAPETESDSVAPDEEPPDSCPVKTPPAKPRRSSRSSPTEEGRPGKADPSTDRPPERPRYLVGRLNGAMPVLRQQAWDAANQTKVPVPTTAPKTRRSWLAALGGVALGMALVGFFYLAALRAGPPAPLKRPPSGRFRAGRAAIQRPAAPAPPAPGLQTYKPPRLNIPRPSEVPRRRASAPTPNP